MEDNDPKPEHSHGEIEPLIEKKMSPSQTLAGEMKKSGVQCDVLEIGSHPIEQKPSYSYLFALSPRLVTNRGLIKIRGRNIDFVQVLQRF